MDKNELSNAASELAEQAVNGCSNEVWDKLEAHALANWSCSPAALIEMGIRQAFGLSVD